MPWHRLSLICALLFLTACSGGGSGGGQAQAQGRGQGRGGGERPAQPPMPVAVQAATLGNIASTYAATATLEAEAEAEILARVSGVVERLLAEEGDAVDAHQRLLQIDNDEYRLRVTQAEATAANLRSRFERMEGMREKQLVSNEEYDALKSELASAEAELGLARLDLGHTNVRAPFRGYVVERLVDAGQNVSDGTPLFRLADFDPLLARVHVPSKEFRRLETNQPVDLFLDSDGTELTGRITLVSPVIDPNTGTIKVTVEITDYPGGVRPGDFAEVRIVTETRSGSTLVPRGSVITDKGDQVVYVAVDDVAERRVVETGFADSQNIEILTGVEPGEGIVVKGQRSLRHGQPVRVLEGGEAATQAAAAGGDAR